MLVLKGKNLYRALIETEKGLVVQFNRIDLEIQDECIIGKFYMGDVLVRDERYHNIRSGDTISLTGFTGDVVVYLGD